MIIMKLILGLMLVMILSQFYGCVHSRPALSEEAWNEDIHQDVKEMTADGGVPELGDTENGLVFFNRSKPQLATVQIWLESSKVITSQIKRYLASFFDDGVSDNTDMAPVRRIVGQWYGLDRQHDAAIVFTFKADGRFIWESLGKTRRGTYEIRKNSAPDLVLLKTDKDDETQVIFEFINDRALLLAHGDEKLIFLKK